MTSLLTASIPQPGTKRRFDAFSAADLELKRNNSVPPSTKKANKKAGRVFNNYLLENAVDKQAPELESSELASLLGKFYFKASTVNGDLYKCSSLENLRHSLIRYLFIYWVKHMSFCDDCVFSMWSLFYSVRLIRHYVSWGQVQIISSLWIPVHSSACGLTMYGDPRLDIIRIRPQLT